MAFKVRYDKPGIESFDGDLLGCHPHEWGILFVKRADTGKVVPCEGAYLEMVSSVAVGSGATLSASVSSAGVAA